MRRENLFKILIPIFLITTIVLLLAPVLKVELNNNKKTRFGNIAKKIAIDIKDSNIENVEINCLDEKYGLDNNNYEECTVFNKDDIEVYIKGKGKYEDLAVYANQDSYNVIEIKDTKLLKDLLIEKTIGDVEIGKPNDTFGLYKFGNTYIFRGGDIRDNSFYTSSSIKTDSITKVTMNNYIKVPWEEYKNDECDNSCYRIMGINEDMSITIIRDNILGNIKFGEDEIIKTNIYSYLYGEKGYEKLLLKDYSEILKPFDVCINYIDKYISVNSKEYIDSDYVKDTCDVKGKLNTKELTSLNNKYVRLPYVEEYLNSSLNEYCTNDKKYQCRDNNYLFNNESFMTLNKDHNDTKIIRNINKYGSANYNYIDNYDGIRPVVTLKSNTYIESGIGTKENPFIIKY